jgi:hypothetical protein
LERIQSAKSTMVRQDSVGVGSNVDLARSEAEAGSRLTEYGAKNVQP